MTPTFLIERHSDAPILAPDNAARPLELLGRNNQREPVSDEERRRGCRRCSRRRSERLSAPERSLTSGFGNAVAPEEPSIECLATDFSVALAPRGTVFLERNHFLGSTVWARWE